MIYIEYANIPNDEDMNKNFSVFIGGEIIVAPWQTHVVSQLSVNSDIIIINPKPTNALCPFNGKQKIEWTNRMINASDVIMFWFPEENICATTLFELGFCLNHPSKKPVFIGTHPNYEKRYEIDMYVNLIQPTRKFDIVHHPDDLVGQIKTLLKGKKKGKTSKNLLKDFYK